MKRWQFVVFSICSVPVWFGLILATTFLALKDSPTIASILMQLAPILPNLIFMALVFNYGKQGYASGRMKPIWLMLLCVIPVCAIIVFIYLAARNPNPIIEGAASGKSL